jgi:hypothetical protein
MLPVKPALEIPSADRAAVKASIKRSPLDSSSSPASPKTRELKARYEASRAAEIAQDPTKVGRP